ncbi:MAG: TRAP transporter small permease subunit [Alphaproteobacteria bacterium]|nr:TRAP transporter small permease subunit [Alphaproteobacteria bacterium]
MGSLLNVARWMDGAARWVGKTIGWIMLPLIFVIMFDVIMRKLDFTRLYFAEYTASSGVSVSTILQDLEWHFHGALLMLTFGFGYLANAHVRVDIFREMLARRRQAWVEFFGLIILGVPFLTLMIIYSFDLTWISYGQGEGSESLTGIGQRWFIKSMMVIGFGFAMLAVLATLFRLTGFLFGSARDQEEALDGLEIFADDHQALEAARLEAERLLRETEEQERALRERALQKEGR